MAPRAQAKTSTMAATKTPGVSQEPRGRRPASAGNRAQVPRTPPVDPATRQQEMYDRAIAEDAAEAAAAAAVSDAPDLELPTDDDLLLETAEPEASVAEPEPAAQTGQARTPQRRKRTEPSVVAGELTAEEVAALGLFAQMAIRANKPMGELADELEILLSAYRKAVG